MTTKAKVVDLRAEPEIEVAADGKTAKGVWMMAGTESGLPDPKVAEAFPDM